MVRPHPDIFLDLLALRGRDVDRTVVVLGQHRRGSKDYTSHIMICQLMVQSKAKAASLVATYEVCILARWYEGT